MICFYDFDFDIIKYIQIKQNDFINKAIIYQDFLSNMKNQNGSREILIFKCYKIKEYLHKIDKQMADYIKILFYLYLKQCTNKSLEDIFVQLLKEKSEGIYIVNKNNFTINLCGLKQLLYPKESKIQETLSKLYAVSNMVS